MADHLSRLEIREYVKKSESGEIVKSFIDEKLLQISQLFSMTMDVRPWFTSFVNFVANGSIPEDLSYHQKKKFTSKARKYFSDEPYLFKLCADHILRICISESEHGAILDCCHGSNYGGHLIG